MKEPRCDQFKTTDKKANIVNRLNAAMETTLHYLKRDHKEYLFLKRLVAQYPSEHMEGRVKEARVKRETLVDEARRLRWIASGRSLSEQRRIKRAEAQWAARKSESNT